LLRLALPLLGEAPTFPVRLKVRDAVGHEAELTFGRNEVAPRGSALPTPLDPPPQGGREQLAGLRRVHRKLLEKATSDPIPTKKLITSAGYAVNTYSRDAVTHLCRAGLLLRTPDGIRRA
jgi:hypothetical protein